MDSDTVPTGTEEVALAEGAADNIAQKTADLVAASEIKSLRAEIADLKAAFLTPKRTDLGDVPTDGTVRKGSDTPVYGGHDKFTSVGNSDGEIASNLFIVKTMLESTRGQVLSERGQQVMINAADRALKAGPRIVDTKGFYGPTGSAFKYDAGQYFSEARTKAMTSTGSNAGDEWVPTLSSADLWTDIHLATQISSQIRRVPMPSNPYTLPTLDDDVTFKYASTENVAVTASNPNTGSATLTAVKIQAEVNFSGEVTEDSIIPIVPAIRANLVRRGAQTIDDLIVHGDTETGGTANVNTDDAAPTSGAFYLGLNGMRKFCLVTNTGQIKQFAGAFTTTLFLNTRALLGKYGARPSDLLLITGVSTTNSIQDVSAFQTLEKYGPQATILTGEVGRLFNIPVLLSEAIPGTSTDKVDDDGKYTTTTPSTNDTDGWFVLANRTQWTQGFRRDFQIESFRDIQKDMNILVASFRMALIPSGIATTHTAVGYDITVL